MRVTLVKIGNSQGVRLPKAVIEQAKLKRDLDLEIVNGAIVIRSARQVRAGWAEAARACRARGDDSVQDWDATISDFAGDWK